METPETQSISLQALSACWKLIEKHRRGRRAANAIAIAEAVAILILLIELYRKM